jgi:hypothetical protein
MVRETSPRPKLRPKGFGVSEQTERMLEPEGDPVSPTEVMKTGLTEEVMGKAQDYVDNPPPEPKKDPLAFAAEKGYVKAIKGPEEKEKYISNLNVGTKEGNQTVRKMFENILGKNPDWDPLLVNWCATFVSDVLDNLGADPLKTNDRYDRLRARKYVKYGSPVERKNIQQGDIVVLDFPRDSEGNITFGPGGKRDGVGDHVTFYVGDKSSANKDGSGYIGVLGGNQGYNSEIGIAEYPEENILAVRRITYDDVDYEFTEALAKDNPNFKAFLKKEGEGFDMKSLEENPMSPSNTPMTSRPQGFDEGGLAENDNLDLARSYGVTVVDPEETDQTLKAFGKAAIESIPGISTAATVRDIKEELEEEDPSWGKIGLLAAGEVVGMVPGLGDAAQNMVRQGVKRFKTKKGSTYEVKEGNTTVRNKAARKEHPGESGIQPQSVKTIYMPRSEVEKFGGVHQNPDIPTEFIPTGPDTAALRLTEDWGPLKAGEILPETEVKFTLDPEVGLNPVEILDFKSPRGIHFGNEIIEVESNIPKVSKKYAEGGAVMNEQMEMAFMAEGGLRDDGLSVDPVSGNDIPNGSMAEEVRDDIPAQLSEGEYVVPADVVRFYGVKFFEDLREEAKRGLAEMESNGRIGGEPVPAGGPQVNEAPVTEQEMAALRELAMEMNVGGMVPSVNPNMQPPPQAVGNAALQQPQMMNKGGTVLGFQSAGDTGTTSDALSAVQSKPLTGGGLGFSLFGPYTNDGSLPTGFGDDTKTTPFEEGQIVELYKDGKVLSFVMMRDYQDYLDKIAEGWLTKEQKDAKIAEEGPTVAGTDDTTTDDEGTGTTDSSNDKTDYRQFTTQTSATPPKNVADMTDDELKVALEGMNIVGRTGSTLAYTMGLPVGALVGSQLAANYNNMLEVARDRQLISDKEYESKRKGSIFGGEKSLFDNLIDRSDQNEKLGTTNKKGKDFGDTWLGDLLGFDGKAGIQATDDEGNLLGLRASFGGARRDQTAVTPSSTYAAPTTGATAPGDMGDGLRGSGSTSSAPKTQAEKTAAAKSATDDWVSATQAVQSTSTDDPKAWSDAIKAQSEASKAATKAIQEASGWSGGFFGSASNPDWRDAAAEGGLMSKKNKKKKK